LLDKLPYFGAVKQHIDATVTPRRLSAAEVRSDAWAKAIAEYLNVKFRSSYGKEHTAEHIRMCSSRYAGAFLVCVRPAMVTWPPMSDDIVSIVKVLPLKEDYCMRGKFEAYAVKASQLVSDVDRAAAVWVGDLCSSGSSQGFLYSTVEYLEAALKHMTGPVYCRTDRRVIRRYLCERKGFQIMNANGAEPGIESILVHHHFADKVAVVNATRRRRSRQ
jgi:hypothetical protein